MSLEEFTLQLPRNAFGPRDAARAGDLWRAFQDAAILGSSRRGWPPSRYRDEACAFVVRAMTAVHHRETRFGEPLAARTWISTFKRGVMSDRQVRLSAVGGGLVAAATQRWVHVRLPDLKPVRASADLERCFGVLAPEGEGDVRLPAFAPIEGGAGHTFAFDAWHTWMDPHAHANHPAYVDWADEAVSRMIAARGADPQRLAPVAEEVAWRSGVLAPERVTVASRLVGRTEAGHAVLGHTFTGGDGRLCAEATTVRALADGDLLDLLGG